MLSVTIQNQQAFNGSQSTITQAAAQTYITNQSDSVAKGFSGITSGTVHASASFNGTDVYFHQGGFLSGLFGNGYIQEGTIEHEALHNMLKLFDEGEHQLEDVLGLPQSSNTSEITDALKENGCAH